MCISCSRQEKWTPSNTQRSVRLRRSSNAPTRMPLNAVDARKQKNGLARIGARICSPCARITRASRTMYSKNTIYRCVSAISVLRHKRCRQKCAATGYLQRFLTDFRRLPHRRSRSSAMMMSSGVRSSCANSTIKSWIRSFGAPSKTMQRKKMRRSVFFLLRWKHMNCCAPKFLHNAKNAIRRKSKPARTRWRLHGRKWRF